MERKEAFIKETFLEAQEKKLKLRKVSRNEKQICR